MSETINGPRGESPRIGAITHSFERLWTIQERVRRAWPRLARRFRLKKFGVRIEDIEFMLDCPEDYWSVVEKGGKRFYVPHGLLLAFHHRFRKFLDNRSFLATDVATAWWPKRSIIKNAEAHQKNRSALRLDITNAFESIETKHVYRHLKNWRRGFRWTSKLERQKLATGKHYFTPDEAWVLARLFTYRGRLRKGSVLSPILFNMLCGHLDYALRQIIRGFGPGIIYTRYGDDLCFSSPEEVFSPLLECILRDVLAYHRVVLNEKKTLRSKNGILRLPGVLVVRGKIQPDSKYIHKMRHSRGLAKSEREGHRGFLMQFERENLPHVLRKFLRV